MKRTTKHYFFPPYYDVTCHPNGAVTITSRSKHKKGRAMSLRKNTSGYLSMKYNNVCTSVHSVVAVCAIGDRPSGMTVNHINGLKHDNHPDNLEYISRSDNIRHAIAHGLHISCTPERMPTFIDGRCKDRKTYRRSWYLKNRDKVLQQERERYLSKKGVAA